VLKNFFSVFVLPFGFFRIKGKNLNMKSHQDLNVWKDSIEFVSVVYRATRKFPGEEIFGLTRQIRRAAISVPSNISEGAARAHPREFVRFLRIATGSLAEVETQIIIASNLQYFEKSECEDLIGKTRMIRAQITGLIKHLEKKT
jgi:four helix bundle protein